MAAVSLSAGKGILQRATQSFSGRTWATTAQEWGAQRGRIKRLYLDNDRTLKEVMHIMKRDHDFHATVKMYQNRLTLWGFEKNNKEPEIRAIVRQKWKRNAISKASEFELRGRPVDLSDVERYLRRKGLVAEEIVAVGSPSAQTPPALTCLTPTRVPKSPAAPAELAMPGYIFKSIRDYFLGSFDAGTWTSGNPSLDCISTKPQGSEMIALKNLFSHHDVACKLLDKGLFEEAGQELGNASVGIKEIISAEHPRTLASLFDLIMLLRGKKRPEIARIVVSQFAALAAVVLPQKHPLGQVCKLLSLLDPAQFELVAITAWQSTVDQFESILGPMHYSTLRCRLEYIQMAESIYGYERAEGMLRDLVRQCESTCRPHDVRLLKLLDTLAEMLLGQGKLAEAEAMAWNIVTLAPSSEPHSKSIDLLCAGLFVVARVQRKTLRMEMAEATLRQAIALNVSEWGWQHALTLKYLLHLEEWLTDRGQLAAADRVRLDRRRTSESIDKVSTE